MTVNFIVMTPAISMAPVGGLVGLLEDVMAARMLECDGEVKYGTHGLPQKEISPSPSV